MEAWGEVDSVRRPVAAGGPEDSTNRAVAKNLRIALLPYLPPKPYLQGCKHGVIHLYLPLRCSAAVREGKAPLSHFQEQIAWDSPAQVVTWRVSTCVLYSLGLLRRHYSVGGLEPRHHQRQISAEAFFGGSTGMIAHNGEIAEKA